VFAFDRTISRLLEMQGVQYVQASLSAFPQGPAFVDHTFSYAIQQHHRPYAYDTEAHKAVAATEDVPAERSPDDSLLQRIGLLPIGTTQLFAGTAAVEPAALEGEQVVAEGVTELRKDLDRALLQLWRQYRIGSIDETAHALTRSGGHSADSVGQESEQHSPSASNPTDVLAQVMHRDDCVVCLTDVAEYAVRLFTLVPQTHSTEEAVKLAEQSVGPSAAVVRQIVYERLLPACVALLPRDNGYCSFDEFQSAVRSLLHALVRDSALIERLDELPHWLPLKALLDAGNARIR
jgi:hypothetical protein